MRTKSCPIRTLKMANITDVLKYPKKVRSIAVVRDGQLVLLFTPGGTSGLEENARICSRTVPWLFFRYQGQEFNSEMQKCPEVLTTTGL